MDKLVKASVFLSYPNIWNLLFFLSSFETSAFNRIVNKSSTESWCSPWYYFWWWILRNAIATSIQFVGIIASTQKQNEDETDVLSYTQFPFEARARALFFPPRVLFIRWCCRFRLFSFSWRFHRNIESIALCFCRFVSLSSSPSVWWFGRMFRVWLEIESGIHLNFIQCGERELLAARSSPAIINEMLLLLLWTFAQRCLRCWRWAYVYETFLNELGKLYFVHETVNA